MAPSLPVGEGETLTLPTTSLIAGSPSADKIITAWSKVELHGILKIFTINCTSKLFPYRIAAFLW